MVRSPEQSWFYTDSRTDFTILILKLECVRCSFWSALEIRGLREIILAFSLSDCTTILNFQLRLVDLHDVFTKNEENVIENNSPRKPATKFFKHHRIIKRKHKKKFSANIMQHRRIEKHSNLFWALQRDDTKIRPVLYV